MATRRVGEVHHTGTPVNQDDALGEEPVQCTEAEAQQRKVEKLGHPYPWIASSVCCPAGA